MSDQKKDQLAEIEDLEIDALSDDALESVAGGASDNSSGTCCSCCSCSQKEALLTEEEEDPCSA